MYQPVIKNSYLTEVKITSAPAVGNVYKFQDIPQLREKFKNVMVIGIEAYSSSQLAVSPLGNPLIAAADVTGAVITLSDGLKEDIYKMPYNDLIPGNNSGLIRIFDKKEINWTKSGVTILNIGTLVINTSFVFNIIYIPVQKYGQR